MALAPLSQTIFLTEDGSTVANPTAVTIPPLVPGVTPTPPPVVQTPADIVTDGTPQIGESFRGVPPSGTGFKSMTLAWLRGATVLSTPGTDLYVGDFQDDLTFRAIVTGDDGSTVESRKTITVGAATPAPTPTVRISSATNPLQEGDSGTKTFTYTVTRSSTAGAVSIPWAFAAGSTNAADYAGGVLPTGGTVMLADGVASGTFQVVIAGDTTIEPDENFTVSITAPQDYAAGATMTATGTILNDDAAPTPAFVFFGPATIAEGN